MTSVDTQSVHRTIDAIWKIEAPRLIAALVRFVRDVGLAEDLAQDALLAALETWPANGIPDKPGAWLMATAKRRAIDTWRHRRLVAGKHEAIEHEQADDEAAMPDFEQMYEDQVGDDLLRLMFISCHPVLATESRIALTLRLLGGLTTEEIARAFLVPEPTIAQRIVRAKRTLAEKRVPFEAPDSAALRERLSSVLEVIYLVFNEGYSATRGEDWLRPALCEDALRLGRILAELAPDHSEAQALVALMELQASRFNARTTADGAPVLLQDQNRALWDQLLIRRGLAALERARQCARTPGSYLLQAEIAACHARATTSQQTDWMRIAMLYDVLNRVTPSPVVELNRAVAVCMAFGPETAMTIVDALCDEPALRGYHLLPSVRGDFLFRLKRFAEARAEFERAAELAGNARERDFLLGRAKACGVQ
ncbi:MAG TPA: RNA polymerase sigma factor [Gammaproteobacteria bacterium]